MTPLARTRARWRLRAFTPLAADAREGDRVQITGRIRVLDETLVAPLSGLTCVGFHARARGATQARGKLVGTGWRETMLLVPFLVERDGLPAVAVEGHHAVFGISGQTRTQRSTARETSFLARHAIQPSRAGLDEVVLEVGRRVTVGGMLVLVPCEVPPADERGFREAPPPEPRLSGSRDMPLVIVTW